MVNQIFAHQLSHPVGKSQQKQIIYRCHCKYQNIYLVMEESQKQGIRYDPFAS